jgi:branched-chain amino acid aminotransferase
MNIKVELTSSPKTKPDWGKIKFGESFTDHMFVMDYLTGKGWHDARIVPYAPFMIDPAAMILHYGQGAFEGMKAYKGDKGEVYIFRPERNFQRMNVSNERLCMPDVDVDFCVKALTELLKVEEAWVPTAPDTSLYIRPFIFATESAVGVHASKAYRFMIILSPASPYYPEGLNPVKILIEDEYVRAVRGGIGFTKGIANYAVGMKAQEDAKKKGYTQVLWLDGIERKYVEEVGTMNAFFVIGDEVVTPPLAGSILAGITRDSSIAMMKDWGLKVSERPLSVDELLEANKNGTLKEAFGTGTAAVISPIGKLYWKNEELVLNNNETGPIARKLYDELTGMQCGRKEDKFGWIKRVV